MVDTPLVLEERRGHIMLLTINRPEARNSINAAVAIALDEALDRAEADPEVRAVVLTGAGDKAFCAGQDLKEAGTGVFETIRGEHGFAGITQRKFTKPFIVAVNGFALGGGTEISLAADLIVAADTANFGLAEVKRGLIAGGGGPIRLRRSISRQHTLEIAMTGENIPAQRGYEMGFVNRVVPYEKLLPEAIALAEMIVDNCPLGVKYSKQLINDAEEMSLDEAFKKSDEYIQIIMHSEDFLEGTRAFAEKRKPVWKGK